jgi:hypothetical protein
MMHYDSDLVLIPIHLVNGCRIGGCASEYVQWIESGNLYCQTRRVKIVHIECMADRNP